MCVYCVTVRVPFVTQVTAHCRELCYLKTEDVREVIVLRERRGEEIKEREG
jgi:hypothetical protein